jgi:hypothetical protein
VQCVDAETLAAWADGGLPKAEAAAVEVHLADCERCTAMLATFARTIPESPAAESLWKRWQLRWLVPVATAATVAALWVLVPRPGSAPQNATLESAPATAPRAPAASNSSQPGPPADTKEREATATRTLSEPTLARRAQAKAAPPDQPLASRQRAADEVREERQAAVAQERAAPAAPPAPAREADRADQRVADTQEAVTLAAPAAGRAAAAAPTNRSAVGDARRQANTESFAPVVAQVEVLSPDPMMRWRVVGAGQVERSTNGGAQWQRATLPESATLTGGSSPAPSICWLVGRTGAIYVTTDGLRFTRVPFQDRTDFLSIQALDARRATVVTIDGRTMRTEDQGANWVRIAP